MQSSLMLVGTVTMFKITPTGKLAWMLVKQGGSPDWSLPQTNARKGESSVRSVIRLMGEQCGINARVLEEVDRINSTVAVNNKTINKRQIFYIMLYKSSGEIMAFDSVAWGDYSKMAVKITSKREAQALKKANEFAKKWLASRKKKKKKVTPQV